MGTAKSSLTGVLVVACVLAVLPVAASAQVPVVDPPRAPQAPEAPEAPENRAAHGWLAPRGPAESAAPHPGRAHEHDPDVGYAAKDHLHSALCAEVLVAASHEPSCRVEDQVVGLKPLELGHRPPAGIDHVGQGEDQLFFQKLARHEFRIPQRRPGKGHV